MHPLELDTHLRLRHEELARRARIERRHRRTAAVRGAGRAAQLRAATGLRLAGLGLRLAGTPSELRLAVAAEGRERNGR